MPSYFFPALSLVPAFDEATLDFEIFAVHRRRWTTSTFDLATLATKHKLHIPYQLMDIYLASCNLEIEYKRAEECSEAADCVQVIRALLYLDGITPFVMPFVATHSVNEYSGINERDSTYFSKKFPDALRAGLTSETGTVEAWPLDLTLRLIRSSGSSDTTSEVWAETASRFQLWKSLESAFPVINLVRRLINSAPMIPDLGASILEIWQGIESLFPTVTAEVSFRIALLVSQLCAPIRNPGATYKETKRKYGIRSKIVHGSSSKINGEDWEGAWLTLCSSLRAVIERGKLPSEEELLSELLPE
jgi:hypothetical protein